MNGTTIPSSPAGHEHGWRYVGPDDQGDGLANCERPNRLGCECGEHLTIPCGTSSTRRCEPCGVRYRRRVRQIATSGSVRVPGSSVVMLTFTAPGSRLHHLPNGQACPCTPPGGVHLGAWNATAAARWNRLCQAIRRELGIHVEYFRATEVQQRGAVHYHVLVRFPVSRGALISTSRLRALAIRHGFGHEVDVAPVGDDARAAGYVAKYVSKSVDDRSSIPWVTRDGEVTSATGRYRVWTASRRWGSTMADVKLAQRAWAQGQAAAGPEGAGGAGGPEAALDPNPERYTATALPPVVMTTVPS